MSKRNVAADPDVTFNVGSEGITKENTTTHLIDTTVGSVMAQDLEGCNPFVPGPHRPAPCPLYADAYHVIQKSVPTGRDAHPDEA